MTIPATPSGRDGWLLPRRVAARVLDLVLEVAPLVALFFAIPGNLGLLGLLVVLFFAGVALLWMALLWPLLEAGSIVARGRTPGMWLTGLRLVSTDGGSLSFKRALARSLLVTGPLLLGAVLYLIPGLVFGVWLVVDVVRRPDRRTWPDRVSGTVVLAATAAITVGPSAGGTLPSRTPLVWIPPVPGGLAAPYRGEPLRGVPAPSSTTSREPTGVEARSGRAVRRMVVCGAALVFARVVGVSAAFTGAGLTAVVLIVAAALVVVVAWGPGRSRWIAAGVSTLIAVAFIVPVAPKAFGPTSSEASASLAKALLARGFTPADPAQRRYCPPNTTCTYGGAYPDRRVMLVATGTPSDALVAIQAAAHAAHLNFVFGSLGDSVAMARGGISGSAELHPSAQYLFIDIYGPQSHLEAVPPGTVMLEWLSQA